MLLRPLEQLAEPLVFGLQLAVVAVGVPQLGVLGAQGWASLFVERLDGDFFNVMGLPLCALGKLLKQLGVNLL